MSQNQPRPRPAPQQRQPAPGQPMTNQQVEQYLGAQYARMLKETPVASSPHAHEASADIRESLQMLARLNQASMQIKRAGRTLPFFG